jgi:hypothetical protein
LALWGLAIGSSLVVGAVVAARTSLPPAVAEFVTAFGGGVLLGNRAGVSRAALAKQDDETPFTS